MKLCPAVFIFLIGFFNSAQAEQPFNNESNFETDLKAAISRASQSPSILSTFLYLPLIDNDGLSSIMTQAQMTVTPQATYAVRGILVQPNSSTDGTCGGIPDIPYTIDNGTGITVQLNSGHAYTTTDASNFALFNLSAFSPERDAVFTLYDVNLAQIGTTSPCIQGGGTCTAANNCGWPTSRTWNP
jgi:hypothetical protein